MIVLERTRLREIMANRELSQSELARRVGVSQATIYKLLTGESFGSRHLHRIARELGTTPAYLTGETDDPTADAPPVPELSFDQRDLVECFAVLTPADRAALLQLARSLAGRPSDAPKAFHSPQRALLASSE